MSKNKENLIIRDARIGFPNFAGKEGKYNPVGRRNFCVFIDDDKLARKLMDEGWNVRHLTPRDPSEPLQYYMQVTVSYENYPPKIVLVSSRGKSLLKEEDINILDWAELRKVDLVIRPYPWEVNGNKGIKGYLKSGYFTIEEDELENDYVDYPDSAQNTVGGCGNCEVCDGHCQDAPF